MLLYAPLAGGSPLLGNGFVVIGYVAPNSPPTADAGDNQDTMSGFTVTLDGSQSADVDGTIAAYAWAQTAGPTVTLLTPTAATTNFVAPDVLALTALTFSLTVTDDDGLTDADTVTVNVSPYATMLIIEDGTIVVDANSYVTVVEVTAYAQLYGATWSPANLALAEQAILRANRYIESLEHRYQGVRVSDLQELSWPRDYVVNYALTSYLANNSIPKYLKNATAEAAILEFSTPNILLTPSRDRNDLQELASRSETVDVLSRTISYKSGTKTREENRFERLVSWLRPLMKTGPGRVYRG